MTNKKRARKVSRSKKGFVLLEVIVAMAILAVVLSSLAALMFQISRGSFLSVGGAYRNGVLLQEVNRLEALPWDSLGVGTTTATVSALPYPHTRQVIVTNPNTNVKIVKLVITPSNALYKPDTATFTRSLSATTNAFNTSQ